MNRMPIAASGPAATSRATDPDPEVPAKVQRRRFTSEYRLRIVKQTDACKKHGEIGALLRREGLYASHLITWRRQREQGELAVGRARLAERLIAATCVKQGIGPHQLTIHADRGAPMRSKLVVDLFTELGIDGSHSRPRVSHDTPVSEAQFRTFKYRPEFPDRFHAIDHARDMSPNTVHLTFLNAHPHTQDARA